ncbi:glycosyltransferase family 4 protein [Enterococcus mundtii]|uniref:Glycosyl transferase family 1 domain-containing protein n=1 Tax=Enterococcus mundtii TaxID=53346 RepID=A0A242L089_ENTMU|nr:glycosyltransferase family 4 protein [Enterococcus mundtii]OTP27616.1 hypothetical protein A5802_001351 [Enterococcus mundtii]OTP27619.1 hypothetical protein A5802_001354 [Enterococcus mundtii]
MRIAFLTYAMAPYRTKQIEHIVDQTDVEMTVYYIGVKPISRSWKLDKSNKFVEKHFIGKYKLGNHFLYYKGVKDIVKENDILMIGGYNSVAIFQLVYYARKYNKKIIFVMDGISPKKIKQTNRLKLFLKSIVLKRVDMFYANGTVSYDYLISNFSVNPDIIYNQFLTVDIKKINDIYFEQKIKNVGNKNPQLFTIMYSGRLLPGKRVNDLLLATSKIKSNVNIKLLIIGDGVEKNNLIEESQKLKIDIEFVDFIEDQKALFEEYCKADCLVLPSEDDAWGLVINEAEAAHLPVVVSDSCGCIYDLVKDDYNGYVYQTKNVEDLAKKLTKLVNNENKTLQMGFNSYQLISKWTFKESAMSFSRMIEELNKNEK